MTDPESSQVEPEEQAGVEQTQRFMESVKPKIEAVVARLKKIPSRGPLKNVIVWTAPEHEQIRIWGEKVKAKEISYYAACIHLRDKVLTKPQRSFEGIRKKLKNFVNYGVFN